MVVDLGLFGGWCTASASLARFLSRHFGATPMLSYILWCIAKVAFTMGGQYLYVFPMFAAVAVHRQSSSEALTIIYS